MKLTYEILRAELAKKLCCDVRGMNKGCGLIEAPMLYEKGTVITSKCCYVSEFIPSDESFSKRNTLFILIGEVTAEDINAYNGSIQYFSAPQSILNVINALYQIFMKYHQWNEDLLDSLRQTSSLNDLLRLSIPIFENPLILIDSRFYRLAYSAPVQSPDFDTPPERVDELWINLDKNTFNRTKGINEQPYFNHLPNDYPRLLINMSEGEYLIGNLSIQASCQKLREYDSYLLTHLASIVRAAMLSYVANDNERKSQYEHMIAMIIRGDVVDEQQLARAMACFDVFPGELFKCLAVRIPETSGKEFVRHFLRILGTHIPSVYIATEGEVAAMVLSVSRTERQGYELLSFLEKKLKSSELRAGLSDSFHNMLFTRHYFFQAKYALECGETTQRGEYVSNFSDYCLDYILENCSGNLRPDMLWNEGFRRLVDHDMKGRANYILTLKAYLDNNLNAQKAAADLFISRNALLARLERIKALLKDDLKDPKVRFRYELSMLLYDKYKLEYMKEQNSSHY